MTKDQVELLITSVGMEVAEALLYQKERGEIVMVSEEIGYINLEGDEDE